MKMGTRLEGALLGAVAVGLLGQVPPFTFLPEEAVSVPIGAAVGFMFGPGLIKKIKKDIL